MRLLAQQQISKLTLMLAASTLATAAMACAIGFLVRDSSDDDDVSGLLNSKARSSPIVMENIYVADLNCERN